MYPTAAVGLVRTSALLPSAGVGGGGGGDGGGGVIARLRASKRIRRNVIGLKLWRFVQ